VKIATVQKQPGEKRRWGIDYSEALDAGDQVISVSSESTPEGLTVNAYNGPDSVRVSCSGGTDGVTYKVTLTVTTTNSNEIFEDELYVRVKEI
jgi:GH24 family phage-related lysozyme (muramidase)